jgi:hypothetical protein
MATIVSDVENMPRLYRSGRLLVDFPAGVHFPGWSFTSRLVFTSPAGSLH